MNDHLGPFFFCCFCFADYFLVILLLLLFKKKRCVCISGGWGRMEGGGRGYVCACPLAAMKHGMGFDFVGKNVLA